MVWPFTRWLAARRARAPAAVPHQGHGQDEPASERDDQDAWDPEAPVELPIDGALDLHHFHPRDLRTLVPDYLRECQVRGILEVRVIHGKGKGKLRRSVHALLERDPIVACYGLAPPERGGWGATLVQLLPKDPT